MEAESAAQAHGALNKEFPCKRSDFVEGFPEAHDEKREHSSRIQFSVASCKF